MSVPVLDSAQHPAVRLGGEVDGFGGELVDRVRIRGRLGGAAGVGVMQGAELGDTGMGAEVVRLSDGVKDFQLHGGPEGVDDSLRGAAQG